MSYGRSLLEFETCLGPIKLNEELLKAQEVSEENLEKMKRIYCALDSAYDDMRGLDLVKDKTGLILLFKSWMGLSFTLQELWNFEENASYFKDFTLPHCTCPVMDNMERLGTKYRIVSGDCIYHGKSI